MKMKGKMTVQKCDLTSTAYGTVDLLLVKVPILASSPKLFDGSLLQCVSNNHFHSTLQYNIILYIHVIDQG